MQAQSEQVDSIEDNVEQAADDVNAGAAVLAQVRAGGATCM